MAFPDLYEPARITAEEVNCLIHAYFLDAGFQHSAFVLRAEGQLDRTPLSRMHIPRGELVELLSKALLYIEAEAHWRGTTVTTNCKAPFSILSRHVCAADPTLPATFSFEPPAPSTQIPSSYSSTNGNGEKRKADTPVADSSRKDKRARTEEMMDLDSVASSLPPTKASTPMPSTPADLSQSLKKATVDGDKDHTGISAEKKPIKFLDGHKTEVFLTSWNPVTPSSLASGSKDTIVNIWNVPENLDISDSVDAPIKLAHLPKDDQGDLTSLDWNSDGTLLAAGSYDAILRMCDSSGKLYYSYEQHKGPIFATRFSHSGKWLLTASLDGSVCVWDIPSKQLHKQYSCHKECCLDVDWISEDIFASCGADAQINIWKLDSLTAVRTLSGHTKDVNQIKCNPKHTLLASCSDDWTARIWNVTDLSRSGPPSEVVRVLPGHEQAVSSVLWCPKTADGANEILATSSFDQTCRMWDSTTGDCLHIFSDKKGPIFALSFSPDARFIATGSGDGWLCVYDVKTKERRWRWCSDDGRPAIFEISWQQMASVNRIALALESTKVGLVDVAKIPALQ
ncbi:WD40 repeat-like protein [Cristinia sonorae]|uniref:WD40 repeat-like protein n=1 Tax=Cristinia sonorae TaxID=1940300 RepID=A0A8K0UN99_9AGAR|nr:WD40 repeat-like protein [Cristinia sonorae]